ncbi:MAG: FAD-binding oxidoreductase [Shimia sp.]
MNFIATRPQHATPTLTADDEVVCHCANVTRAQSLAAAETQGGDPAAIGRATGAGQTCGGCTARIGQIVGRETMGRARLLSRTPLDPFHAAFRFAVEGMALTDDLPCTDILLDTWIGGQHHARSYTVTDLAPQAGEVEIVVRREALGIVSRWLHDSAGADHLFHVSAPFGGLDTGGARVVLASGGIGITPTLSWLRHAARTGGGASPAAIHWWARHEDGEGVVDLLCDAVTAARAAGAEVEL